MSADLDLSRSDEDDAACPRCGGEGWIDITDGDPSDWQEDTCADLPGTLIRCRICHPGRRA